MITLALLSLGQLYLGAYESKIGQLGAGGLLTSITLGSQGEYQYRHRGCFSNVVATGSFCGSPGSISLLPPDSFSGGGGAWKADRRFRIVPFKGSMYLVEEKDWDLFSELARKGKVDGSSFFVKG